jgi:hypothetical protein
VDRPVQREYKRKDGFVVRTPEEVIVPATDRGRDAAPLCPGLVGGRDGFDAFRV